jgi:hypothetical protein
MRPGRHARTLVCVQHQGLRRWSREAEFLNEVSQLVGEYRHSNTTKSRSRQGISYDHDTDRKERILDVSDLTSLPRGQAIMLASCAPAALLETVPWMQGKHAEAAKALITAHDPSTRPASAVEPHTAVNPWVAAAAGKGISHE